MPNFVKIKGYGYESGYRNGDQSGNGCGSGYRNQSGRGYGCSYCGLSSGNGLLSAHGAHLPPFKPIDLVELLSKITMF